MRFSFKKNYLKEFFTITIIIILYGKFYYLTHGFNSRAKPLAPLPVILIKDVLFLVFLFYFSYVYILSKKLVLKLPKFFLFYFILFFGLSCIHLSHLQLGEFAQHHLRNLYMQMLLTLLVCNIYTFQDTSRIYKIVGILCLASVPFALVSVLFFQSRTYFGRAIGLTDNPDTYGAFLTFGMAYYLSMFNHFKKIKYLVAFLGVMFGLLLTLSVTYVLIAGMFVGSYILIFSRHRWLYFLTLLLMLIVPVLFVDLEYVLKFVERLESLTHVFTYGVEQMSTVRDRVEQIKGFLEYLNTAPWLDILIGDFSTIRYQRFDNMYIVISKNFGMIGLITVLSGAVYLFARLIRYRIYSSLPFERVFSETSFYYVLLIMISALAHNEFNRVPVNSLVYIVIGFIFLMLNAKRQNDRGDCET